jgi:O-antigen ligase
LVFIAVNLILISIDIYYFAFLPVILLFAFASFFSIDKILLSVVFFTPISIQLRDLIPSIPVNLSLPTEPLLAAILFLFICKLLMDGKFDRKIILHPVSIAIYINVFWIFITSLTSTMPAVSFKFLLSRLWFVVGAYFLMTQIFKNQQNVNRFIWLYVISLSIVILYTNIRLAGYGLNNQSASNWVVAPFFSDHTSYGAMLVMFVFPLIYYMLYKKDNLLIKTTVHIFLILFILAIVLSYTRAAWLSLFASIALWLVIKLKIKIKTVLILGFTLVISFLILQNRIVQNLENNQSESSGKFSEHIESMANITTDASNLERINRWKCAIRMFEEKPFLGFGPGTYMFQYAPFQFSYERSIISTNFGNLGNAHSEYLGPLSESGFFGMLTFMLIVFMAYRTGYRVYHKTDKKELKEFTLFILLGFTTYVIHGFLNNFLDTDKASIPFWGFIAIFVALDIYHTNTSIKITQD